MITLKMNKFFILSLDYFLIILMVFATSTACHSDEIKKTDEIKAINEVKEKIQKKVEEHLKDKVCDVAEIIDLRIASLWQCLEGISRAPMLKDPYTSYLEKAKYLSHEGAFYLDIIEMSIADCDGNLYLHDGKVIDISNREYFKEARDGRRYLSKPYISSNSNKMIATLSVPIYDDNLCIVAVLVANTVGSYLSDITRDIVVGDTGGCYLINVDGIIIAHQNLEFVENYKNMITESKKDSSLVSLANFLKIATSATSSGVGYYTYQGTRYMAAYSKLRGTGDVVIIRAPLNELMK